MEKDNLWFPLQDWDNHTHLPHPPATPTSHTYLLHPPATSISPMTHVCGGWVCQVGVSGRCVRWACQVGVSGGCVTPTYHTHMPHPPDTPTTLQPFPLVLWLMYVVDVTGWCVRWVGLVGVVGGNGRWVWQVGVAALMRTVTYSHHSFIYRVIDTRYILIIYCHTYM